MSIEVEPNPDNSPIDTVIKRLYERSNTKALDVKAATVLERTTVAGTVAYKTTILPGSTDFHMLLPHNKKVYHLLCCMI